MTLAIPRQSDRRADRDLRYAGHDWVQYGAWSSTCTCPSCEENRRLRRLPAHDDATHGPWALDRDCPCCQERRAAGRARDQIMWDSMRAARADEERLANRDLSHPDPEQRAIEVPADDPHVPRDARELAAKAIANGWVVRITYARGSGAEERRNCPHCGASGLKVTTDGRLHSHDIPGDSSCPGATLDPAPPVEIRDPVTGQPVLSAAGKPTRQKRDCTVCGTARAVTNSGTLSKHPKPDGKCSGTTFDPDSSAYLVHDSILVRCTRGKGLVGVYWTDGARSDCGVALPSRSFCWVGIQEATRALLAPREMTP